MSPGLDITLTVVGFVLLLPGVIFVVGTAPTWFMFGDSADRRSPPTHQYLILAAIALPPVVVIGLYLAAIVLACLASGLTFYYPLVALALGAAAWFGIIGGVGQWIKNL